MSIDPTKIVPQAPRVLRAGSKGAARAKAAEDAGKPPPDPADDDDEDSDGGDGDDEDMSACAEACRTASDACGRAQEQLDACATECEGGTDSVSTLSATEAACDEAIEELTEAKASCAALRGVGPGEQPGMTSPPPQNARAVAKASAAPTAEAHVETARLAAFGAYTLQRLGLTSADVVKAKGILGGQLDLAVRASEALAREAKTRAKSDDARRVHLWEQAVRDRRVQLPQAFAREEFVGRDGKSAARRVYAEWAKAQNTAYPEIDAFEAWISSRVPEPGNRSIEPSTALSDVAHERHAAAALSERDKLEARRAGVDPNVLAAQVAMMQRGPSRDEERA